MLKFWVDDSYIQAENNLAEEVDINYFLVASRNAFVDLKISNILDLILALHSAHIMEVCELSSLLIWLHQIFCSKRQLEGKQNMANKFIQTNFKMMGICVSVQY